MADIRYEGFLDPIRSDILDAQCAAWDRIGSAGSWWTGEQRVAMAEVVRAARKRRGEPPWLRAAPARATDVLSARVVEVARRVAIDAHKLDRDWCEASASELGDAAYVELVAVAVLTTVVDSFSESIGAQLVPLPEAKAGEIDEKRPEGVGDAGAWVEMTTPWPGPNVGRALSLAPLDQAAFMGLVGSMYALGNFTQLVWDGPLSRPQTELVAARVSAINECFY
jgi:alkylhydroperoxidase family enzyme